MKKITIVVSLFNEEDTIIQFWKKLKGELYKIKKYRFEIIFVNDGSKDSTFNHIRDIANKDNNVKVLSFSTNFGHEAAMIAGIDHSTGDAVICMDGDLQHPPKKIRVILNRFEKGLDVIRMVRENDNKTNLLKSFTSNLFYFFINRISTTYFEPNATDFFLISRQVKLILQHEFRERNRFIRGFTQLVGFKNERIIFKANRRVAGRSKYSYKKLLILALTAFIAFSNLPLHISLFFGFITGLISLGIGIYIIILNLLGKGLSQYYFLVVLISFMFSAQFILIGIIGEYISFMFTETKKRPIYIIQHFINFKNSR